MALTDQYLDKCELILDTVRAQSDSIRKAAAWCAESILNERIVHMFASGHSRIMVEEMWPRYGSFPGFNPIVELSLTFHNLVVGANGQRQAMFLENVTGLAERILRNYILHEMDTAIVISSSGTNIVPIEMAELFQQNKIKVIAIITNQHSYASESKRQDGKKLSDFADLILDTGAPVGDAMIWVHGMESPVAPGSTIGGVAIVNCIKAELAQLLTDKGKPPIALVAGNIAGKEKATAIFESAYDEHALNMSRLYNFSKK
jgi:uncharacterized phosphosugar-binding protein